MNVGPCITLSLYGKHAQVNVICVAPRGEMFVLVLGIHVSFINTTHMLATLTRLC
jgi:hypothetical protein